MGIDVKATSSLQFGLKDLRLDLYMKLSMGCQRSLESSNGKGLMVILDHQLWHDIFEPSLIERKASPMKMSFDEAQAVLLIYRPF